MKRKVLIPLFLVFALMLSTFVFSAYSSPVIEADAAEADHDKVVTAKIENLLNLNNLFGEDFLDNQVLVNRAMINLKNFADDEGFIPQGTVVSYIKDMYDIDLDITDYINPDMPTKDGFIYLVPKGYTVYRHQIVSFTKEDGYLTVISNVSIDYHDGAHSQATAKTVLIKNDKASFGYNILNCELTFPNDSLSI